MSVILTEFLEGGELFRYISSTKYNLTEAKCQAFAKQIIRAVEFMHSKRIIHLDLKPENILLVHNLMKDPSACQSCNDLKLIDFGLARNMGKSDRLPINMCGTLEFISPEVMRCSHASFASDMWSVGVILYMMISGGISPFWAGTEYRTQYLIHRAQLARGGFKHPNFKHVSTSAIDFVKTLLALDPKSRLSASECLRHEWFGIFTKSSGLEQLKQLECTLLRKYLARRRWKRWFNTIKAMNRMLRIVESGQSSKKYKTVVAIEHSEPRKHINPIIGANELSDRLQRLMKQNYGDLGMG